MIQMFFLFQCTRIHGSGFPNELGGPNAVGTNLNIPLPPATSTEGYMYIMENTVMPALEAFKPKIIVNSAGQDNHYTDPLTNMNFSAQGYADLTTMLKPDIAVLEGGYSIEGALPYVNLGIILAMAGLDYSGVIEPDFNPEKLRQSQLITDKIKSTSKEINNSFQNREELREKAGKHGEIQQKTREIYYDTDNLYERQNEKIRVCRDCGGTLEIDSKATPGQHILAIHIPHQACDKCIEAGYDIFDKADTEKYDNIFLQDRPKDIYKIKEK